MPPPAPLVDYRSIADLARDVATWSESLPRDIDLVVGIPRSGMLAGSLLALYMDRPLVDLDGYLAGRVYSGGMRVRERHGDRPQRALVVDDSVATGRAMTEARELVVAAGLSDRTTFGAVYTAEDTSPEVVEHRYVAVPTPRVFEWNVLHHNNLGSWCMDIDGVLCRDPGEMENDDGEAYTAFLSDVPARLVPGHEVGWLVTSRLERYRPQTEAWLEANGIRYRELRMHPASTGAERRAAGDHAQRKAAVYRETGARLFIESDARQAVEIAGLSGQSVFCTDTREMVQPGAVAVAREKARATPRSLARRLRNRLLPR